MKNLLKGLAIITLIVFTGSASAAFVNASFEDNIIGNEGLKKKGGQNSHYYTQAKDKYITGWTTTSTDHKIELWETGFLGVDSINGSYSGVDGEAVDINGGAQFAELNATQHAALYQDTNIISDASLQFQFAHRGRAGKDTMEVTITGFGLDDLFGTDDDTIFTKQYTTDKNAWNFYTSFGLSDSEQATLQAITTDSNEARFSFGAISTAGSISVGNFLDVVDFGQDIGVQATPIPAAVWLFSTGLVGLVGLGKKKAKT